MWILALRHVRYSITCCQTPLDFSKRGLGTRLVRHMVLQSLSPDMVYGLCQAHSNFLLPLTHGTYPTH